MTEHLACPESIAGEVLFGNRLFSFLNSSPRGSFPLALFAVVSGAWLSFQTGLEPVLLFYSSSSSSLSKAWLFPLFIAGWLATFVACNILSAVLFHKKGGELRLLNNTAFAILPLLIVPTVLYIILGTGSIPDPGTALILAIVSLVIQGWIVCLLSKAVSLSKGLALGKSMIVGLAVMLLNVASIVTAYALKIL